MAGTSSTIIWLNSAQKIVRSQLVHCLLGRLIVNIDSNWCLLPVFLLIKFTDNEYEVCRPDSDLLLPNSDWIVHYAKSFCLEPGDKVIAASNKSKDSKKKWQAEILQVFADESSAKARRSLLMKQKLSFEMNTSCNNLVTVSYRSPL